MREIGIDISNYRSKSADQIYFIRDFHNALTIKGEDI